MKKSRHLRTTYSYRDDVFPALRGTRIYDGDQIDVAIRAPGLTMDFENDGFPENRDLAQYLHHISEILDEIATDILVEEKKRPTDCPSCGVGGGKHDIDCDVLTAGS